MTGDYDAQVRQQLADARTALAAAEAERAAALRRLDYAQRCTIPDLERRIADHRASQGRWRTRAEQAEARIAAVRALAADMRTWCSPHGLANHYADQVDAALDGPDGQSCRCGHGEAAHEQDTCRACQAVGLTTLHRHGYIPAEQLACCVCGTTTSTPYFNHLNLAFCPLCADCQCGQTPCERTGIADPAVSSAAIALPRPEHMLNLVDVFRDADRAATRQSAADTCPGRPGFCRPCRTVHPADGPT